MNTVSVTIGLCEEAIRTKIVVARYNIRYNIIMVTTKVRKVGSSLGVILARPMVEALGARDGDEVVISQGRGRLSVIKLSPSSKPFLTALSRTISKYRTVLSRLDD